ncbi:hypothetical protein PHET_08707 [Paragonimus heterotremus]|uniref:Uncharacterized protein n=1 Tax=Paragonimus heterotremus TaxID=100268 RepID=A0A8J4SHF8_9TREM|nr:hypothetical protein PHET_08707 [Paragonimus heterotremus]
MFVALTNSNGPALGTQFLNGLGNEAAKSILINRGDVDKGCIELASDLDVEHPYLRSCLLHASACEYGITWAAWLQFLSPDMTTREILIGTGPISAQGFQFYLEHGEIVFDLWTESRKWSVRGPFMKQLHFWNNIAVVWDRQEQTMTVLVKIDFLSLIEPILKFSTQDFPHSRSSSCYVIAILTGVHVNYD